MRGLRTQDYRVPPTDGGAEPAKGQRQAAGATEPPPASQRIDLVILGEPVANARHRSARRKLKDGTKIQVNYTPDETVAARLNIQEAFVRSGCKPFPERTPLQAIITGYFKRSKSVPKSQVYPITKPDWDNVGKLVTDALEGIAFDNDSRFGHVTVGKYFAVYPEPPRLVINISRRQEVTLSEKRELFRALVKGK